MQKLLSSWPFGFYQVLKFTFIFLLYFLVFSFFESFPFLSPSSCVYAQTALPNSTESSLQSQLLISESGDLFEKISILSDKAFKKKQGSFFEAIGNVAISYQNDALYGEKANFNAETGDIHIEGNVRYVGSGITVYCSHLYYNFKTKKLWAQKAKIVTESYVLRGERIDFFESNKIHGENIEYSTCRDCPESWAVIGSNVEVTLGNYIELWNVYIKIGGVILSYVPYIVFPIKKGRESGLLFPQISYNMKKGILYKQPFFLITGETQDLTISPFVFAKKGYGSDFEYQYFFDESKWAYLNSMLFNDKIYTPDRPSSMETNTISGKTFFRDFSETEGHYAKDSFLNAHWYFSRVRDTDIFRDFESERDFTLRGTDLGLEAFFDIRTDYASFTLESYHRRNLLTEENLKFDDSYVQILPTLKIMTVPFELFSTKYFGLQRLAFGFESEGTIFKQQKLNEDTFIRNAARLDLSPYLRWDIGTLGPLSFDSKLSYDGQIYDFFRRDKDDHFTKSVLLLESSLSFKWQAIYSEAKKVETSKTNNLNDLIKKTPSCLTCPGSLLGGLPDPESLETASLQDLVQETFAYKHTQEFVLKHYAMFNENFRGNTSFFDQIQQDSGIFDFRDAPRSLEHTFSGQLNSLSVPRKDTLELGWNHYLMKKSVKDVPKNGDYLRSRFDYDSIAYLNFSQIINISSSLAKNQSRPERSSVALGVKWDNVHLLAQEYYFNSIGKNALKLSLAHALNPITYRFSFEFDETLSPKVRKVGLSSTISVIDTVGLSFDYRYDFYDKRMTDLIFKVTYMPSSNCLRAEFGVEKKLIDTRFLANLMFNFSGEGFVNFN